jgi:YesN/AraC family two-component response regulator
MYQEFISHNFPNIPVRLFPGEPCKKESATDWHFHEEMEFLWIRANNKKLWVDNSEYTLQENDIVFLATYVPHKTHTPKECETFLLQCKPFLLPNEATMPFFSLSQHKNFFIFRADTPESQNLRTLFQRIREEYLNKENAHHAFIRALVMELFAYLYRYNILPNPDTLNINKEKQAVMPVIEYTKTHYAEPISLKTASDILHIDKSYLCRLFKKAIGLSYLEYVYFLRIAKAEELLLKTEKTVTEIAHETGFPSSAYFTKVFKKRKGYTPTFYKKLQKR